MKAFKGFDKDMKCKDFQFEEGKTYEEPTASLCEKGFHACENPLDVLNHYPLLDNDAEPNRFAEVDLEANDERKNDDSKRVGKKIHIKAEFSLKGLIKAGIDFLLETNTAEKDTKEVSSERFSKLAASGYGSKLAASGDDSQLAASGDGSKLAASGENSVVANIGINGIAKAAKGCWITLAEWKHDGEKWVPLAVVTRQVDGEEIKADTWYKLEGDGYELVCAHEAPKDGSA
jgi:hypothetical protein